MHFLCVAVAALENPAEGKHKEMAQTQGGHLKKYLPVMKVNLVRFLEATQ